MRPKRACLTAIAAAASLIAAAAPAASAATPPAVPHYDHVFLIVEENNGFSDIIGNPAAPNFNRLAGTYGLATNYYGVSHPSEPNYVALLGGDTFGVSTDNPYFINPVHAPSLISQLDQAGISWKAYLQGSPHPGYQGICYPAYCNGTPDSDPLYVSKHDAIMNFTGDRTAADWARQVPFGQLAGDLGSGHVPAFSYVIPDECRDEHGDPPFCVDSGSPGDPQNQHLVATGDAFLGATVSQITSAPFWRRGNNAIFVVYDEGDDSAHGGGHVPSIVITSHGPRAAADGTFYSHYSLLATVEGTLGVGCLAHACDPSTSPMTPLLRVTGSPAQPFRPVPVPAYATPSPVPPEPVSSTSTTVARGGWTVVPSPLAGTGDNSLGGIAAAGPGDIWAVGNFLPDATGSNPDATLTLAGHYDGRTWTVTPTPGAGANFSTLFGVTAAGGSAWADGVYLDSSYRTRGLMERWHAGTWSVVPVPQPGSQRDMLFGISADSPSDIWAVGTQQGGDGVFRALAEHWDGHTWSAVPSPDPGAAGDFLHAVSVVSPSDVWAVGQRLGNGGPDQALAEHWDGHAWSVVPLPASPGNAALFGVTASSQGVYAVGESQDPAAGATPVVLYGRDGSLHPVSLPAMGSAWTDLYGVAASGGHALVVGTSFDAATGTEAPLILAGDGSQGWHAVPGPNPSNGQDNAILGGIVNAGGTLWAAGTYGTGGSRLTMLEHS